ncbi:RNA-binding protein BRN1-like [Iris pallida]|uniref:RNA-binding protein BRN1-like n=1 Tax=Iris pallida TaxID=29817 RepID=A0AAX6FA27_IRIPA|nr:RNA-binding protein BRN1-like [Iris pallida]
MCFPPIFPCALAFPLSLRPASTEGVVQVMIVRRRLTMACALSGGPTRSSMMRRVGSS